MHQAYRRRPAASARRPAQWWGIVGVVAALSALTLALLPTLPDLAGAAPVTHHVGLRLVGGALLIAAMYALAEIFVLHIQVKREAQTLALSEIPVVLAVTFAVPAQTIAGMVLGAALAYVLHRRQRGLKLTYNLTLKATDAVVTLAIYSAVIGSSATLTPQWMLAAYVSVAATALMDGIVTRLVIGLHEGSLSMGTLLREVAVYPALAFGVATLAVVVAFALDRSPVSAVPALASGVFLVVGYRAYAKLSERHLSLERLYRFSQAVTSTPEVNETLTNVLTQAKELLRSEHAEITFFSGLEGNVVRVALSPSGRLLRESVLLDEDDPTTPTVVGAQAGTTTPGPLMILRTSKDPAAVAHLAARRWREALVVPLVGDAGVVGTLAVADRMGKVRGFDPSDLRLLETVANHAGVALQNSRLIDRLRHESLHDALTGLPNRVLLRSNALAELSACEQSRSVGCAMMIMDLDRFKDVNDTLGHQHGDELLMTVAARTVTAAGPQVTVARLGGDEFALLVPGCPDGPRAHEVATRVLAALEVPTVLDGIPVQIGASIGIALAPLHAMDVTDLMRHADVAMYAAKNAGGGVRLYESDTDTSSPDRLALVMELRTALDEGDVTIHVQPKASLLTREVVAVEVLARWNHPRHGLIMPDEFIPLAERAGLMRPLSEHVLRLALQHCADWRSRGIDMNVAVNLSARTLTDPDLCQLVAALLAEYDVAARMLTLEITESSVMADPDAAIEALQQLRAIGVRLSVDDFGVGYSSLSNLSRMPVHELKIDRSFVLDLADSIDSAVITRSIIDLGRNLALDVIAEGVEDQQAWDMLSALGCVHAQGYFIARPMPPEVFPAWLQRWDVPRPVPLPREPAEVQTA